MCRLSVFDREEKISRTEPAVIVVDSCCVPCVRFWWMSISEVTRMLSLHHLSFFVSTITLFLLLTPQKSDGCFETSNVLDPLSVWIQPISLDNRFYYHPTIEGPDKLKVESERNFPKYIKKIYTCLEEFKENRMMVEVQQEGKKTYFQCLKFETLSDNIVRQHKTKLRTLMKKVDCENEKYIADEAVLVALNNVQPQPCPLQGGYQMLLHEGEIIRGHCLDSIVNYNPNIRFQCDQRNVIADFGRECEPATLAKSQQMRRRHIAHLSCIGSWDEKGDIHSVLLRMRDQPYTMWCIHYKDLNGSIERLSVFITIDGRCLPDAFHDEAIPKKTGLFGLLASYVPANDPRCSHSQYRNECLYKKDVCFDSDECPSICNRCNKSPQPSGYCHFQSDTIGHWETVDSKPMMVVDIDQKTLTVDKYGEFSCRDEIVRRLPGKVFAVVQHDETSTCLPFYACAQVMSPAPGVLYFNLRPVWRDEISGHPFTCEETDDKIGYIIPAEDERTITMINREILAKSSCAFDNTHKFPTSLSHCLLEIGECSGDCHKLVVKYDNDTCGDQISQGFPIETEHDCYANFELKDGIQGLLTYSNFSERFFCWIYSSSRLLIASPGDCNFERVERILADPEANVTYDPANALSKPVFGRSKDKKDDNSNNHCQRLCCNGLTLSVLLLLLLLLMNNYRML